MAAFPVASEIFAPIITWAAQTYGERPLAISGGIISSLALCLASQVGSLTSFGILLFLSGIGSSMAVMSLTSAIPKYFPDNIKNVFGLICAVGAIGIMVFPPVNQHFIFLYGWRGALLIFGAINANIVVCGALVRPLKSPHEENYTQVEGDNMSERNVDAAPNEHSRLSVHMNKLMKYLTFLFIDHPRFTFIVISEILSGVIWAGWVIFLVPHAINKGIPHQMASFLSSSGALGTIIGRILMGYVIQGGHVTTIQFYIILGLLNTGVFCLDLISESFAVLAIFAFINGLASGILSILSFCAAAEILGDDSAVEGYSVITMFFPIGDQIGGILLGYFVGMESSTSFLLLGGVSALIVIVNAVALLVPMKRL
ncbi:monocarboxylate transporter 2-like [Amphiura filiformis]|uniref:monocarboxylate transporter 2-like n=1 Tax=Amphiura filiformis TaxID=82378 RepID=UPI003B211553